MIGYIRKSFINILNETTWMDPISKARSIEKVDLIIHIHNLYIYNKNALSKYHQNFIINLNKFVGFFYRIIDEKMNKVLSYIIINIVIITVIIYSNTQQHSYNLYYTDIIAPDLSHHCLYFSYDQSSTYNSKELVIEQTIEYCFRPILKKEDIVNEFAISAILTFDQMKKENITSENLIEWSTPIDLIERYENYLQTNQSSLNDIFYKCIQPWFGPFCQYSFDYNQTFSNILKVQFSWKVRIKSYPKSTCYMHIRCLSYSYLLCLDWREICNGKIDCIDGEDEQNCFELEINKCNENEYQCRNGMCVDKSFLLDDAAVDLSSPECLDGSDEAVVDYHHECATLVIFLCEDTSSRYLQDFSCGDGEFFLSVLPRDKFDCHNGRDAIFNYFVNWNNRNDTRFPYCFKTYICTSKFFGQSNFDVYCKSLCQNKEQCRMQTLQLCPSYIIAPTFPVCDGHVRLGYFSNKSLYAADTHAVPHFVCFDNDKCPFLIPTFILENYTCIVILNLLWLISNHEEYHEIILKQDKLINIIKEAAIDEQYYIDTFMPRTMKNIKDVANKILNNLNIDY